MNRLISTGLILLSAIQFSCGQNKTDKKQFTESFNIDGCTFSTTGRNRYFILEPGYRLELQGVDENDTVSLIISVLGETKIVGGIETRIVEERESVNGSVFEVSRNFFAFCNETGSIFYFGEEVDMYKDGKVINHAGAWIAEGENKAGVMMPGLPLLGSRYYQEIAPGAAMDRAEIISLTEVKSTPAGDFINVLKAEETTPLEPKDRSYKLYAPGIGMIQDDALTLVRYGFIKE